MPTYVYACDECGVQFEEYQSFNSKPLEICPHGHEGKVRRVFQPVGIVFKGSGWYITDSRKSDSAGVGLSDSSSKNGAEAKSGDSSIEKAVEKTSEKSTSSETISSESKSSSTPTSTPASTTT